MKKIVLSILFGLLSTVSIYAQNAEVERLLSETKKMLNSKGSQTATFRSTLYDASGQEVERQQGRLYIQGSSFRLEYGAIVAVFSGKKLSHYNKDEHTLTFSEPSAEELVQINPLYFLRSYSSRYKARLLSESKQGPIVGFTPIKQESIKSIELQLGRANHTPREVLVLSTDGFRLVIKIDTLEQGVTRDQSFFTLRAKDYPGVEVVSLD